MSKLVTYILSSDHHATHEPTLVDRPQGSSLPPTTNNEETFAYGCEAEELFTRVKQNKPVGTDEVDTTSTSLGTEEEDEFLALWIIELVHKLLPFRDVHGAIQTEVAIPEENRLSKTSTYTKPKGEHDHSLLGA